ncbi:MAG: hypothetical protein CMP11_03600 [Zetaproteobacteria bacterium]|nr:hypothetical protein [Pseudobdellovibrionaceae bacterium]
MLGFFDRSYFVFLSLKEHMNRVKLLCICFGVILSFNNLKAQLENKIDIFDASSFVYKEKDGFLLRKNILTSQAPFSFYDGSNFKAYGLLSASYDINHGENNSFIDNHYSIGNIFSQSFDSSTMTFYVLDQFFFNNKHDLIVYNLTFVVAKDFVFFDSLHIRRFLYRLRKVPNRFSHLPLVGGYFDISRNLSIRFLLPAAIKLRIVTDQQKFVFESGIKTKSIQGKKGDEVASGFRLNLFGSISKRALTKDLWLNIEFGTGWDVVDFFRKDDHKKNESQRFIYTSIGLSYFG